MMRKVIYILFLGCLLPAGLHAQGAGQAGEFLRWGVGGRAMGLGRAYTSLADDASAPYWNPAGLSALPRIGASFMFMHLPLRDGASFNYLAGGIPLRLFFVNKSSPGPFFNAIQDFNLGFGYLWHSLGDFEFYNNQGLAMGEASASIEQSAFYFSLAYPLNLLFGQPRARGFWSWTQNLKGDLTLGVTAKFVRQNLFQDTGTATSFDLGLKYTHFSETVSVGFMWRDVNQPYITYDTDLIADAIPAFGVVGLSVRPPFGYLNGLVLTADYGAFKPTGRKRDMSLGAEYDLSAINADLPVKLRFGMNSNQERFTFGINFSPEILLGQDWVPSGDWTYANVRGGFDPTGTMVSFSLDRNPFTARYWYLNAVVQFLGYDCGNLNEISQNDRIPIYLRNAEKADNPGEQAYRYEASLRKADYDFLAALADLQSHNPDIDRRGEKIARTFTKISKQYTTRASRLMNNDSGKEIVDESDYINSFIYYVQSLILSGQLDAATHACADSGRSWGKRLNVFKVGQAHNKSQIISYLYAFTLYKKDQSGDAVKILQADLDDHPLGNYLLGHISFLQGHYARTLQYLDGFDLNKTTFPKHIYLPITYDCTFGDEILFLRAASLYKLGKDDPGRLEDCLQEFAMIPRFFPNSDFAKFLLNGNALMSRMLKNYREQQYPELETLIDDMIASYIRSFTDGSLKEESYTYHYR